MITRVNKSSHLNSLVDYIYQPSKRPLVVDSTCMDSEKKATLTQLRQSISQRRDVKNPIMHAMISLDKQEHLRAEQWEEVTKTYMKQMGFTGCRYVAVKHHDTDHEHIHILASRIRADGSLVPEAFDWPKSEKIARRLEHQYNLKAVPNSWEVELRAKPQHEWHMKRRTKQHSARDVIAQALDKSVRDDVDIVGLKAKLGAQNIRMVPKLTRDEQRIVGVYFEHKGVRIAGSKVHKQYGWNRLSERVGYHPERDLERLKRTPEMDKPVYAPVHRPDTSLKRPSIAPQSEVKPVPNSPKKADQKAMTRALNHALDRAQWDKGIKAWHESLKRQGVDVVPKVTQKDQQKIVGIYFEHQGQLVSGSTINRAYSWGNIQKRLDTRHPWQSFDSAYVPGVGRIQKPIQTPKQETSRIPVSRVLASFETPQAPYQAKNQDGLLSVEDVINRQNQQTDGQWRRSLSSEPRQMKLLSRDLVTKEGRFHVLLGDQKQVVLMPYDRQLESVRDQMMFVSGDKQGQPRRVVDVQERPLLATRDAQRPIQSNKQLAAFTNPQVNYHTANNAKKEPVDLQTLVQKQSNWSIGASQNGHYTLMETDVMVKQGRHHLFVNAQHEVVLTPYNKHLESYRGRDVEISKVLAFTNKQRPDAPKVQQTPQTSVQTDKPKQSLAKWIEQYRQGGQREALTLKPGTRFTGQLQSQDVHLQEGRFSIIKKKTGDVALVPYDKQMELLRGKHVRVERDREGRMMVQEHKMTQSKKMKI